MTTRRQFMALTGAAALASQLPTAFTGKAFAADRTLKTIGVQLYTVRGEMAKSVDGTLEKIAGLGFSEVEAAGYYDLSAKDFRGKLDALGLTSPSAHIGIEILMNNTEATIEFAKTVGHKYIVIPWLTPDWRNLEGYGKLIDAINRIAPLCKAAGMQLVYHNHDFEFDTIDGQIPMQMILNETDPDMLQVELDLFWCHVAGVDPMDYINAHPGRVPSVHVKDRSADGKMVSVGAGVIDFSRIFAASEKAGLNHYFVEHDNPANAFASIEASINHLKKLHY